MVCHVETLGGQPDDLAVLFGAALARNRQGLKVEMVKVRYDLCITVIDGE